MELLSKTAKKEDQLTAINTLIMGFNALMAFADGDEQPLEQFKFKQNLPAQPEAAKPVVIEKNGIHIVPAAQQQPLRIVEASNTLKEQLQATVHGPEKPCTCEIAVKEKNGDPYTCLKCGGNAYTKHYVFDHTDDGKRLLTNAPADAFDKIEDPVAEFIPMPNDMLDIDYSLNDRYDIEQYA